MDETTFRDRNLASLTQAHRKLDEMRKVGKETQETAWTIHSLIRDQLLRPEDGAHDLAKTLGQIISVLAATIGEMRDTSKRQEDQILALRQDLLKMHRSLTQSTARIEAQLGDLLDILDAPVGDLSES